MTCEQGFELRGDIIEVLWRNANRELLDHMHEVWLDEFEFWVTEVAIAFMTEMHSKFWMTGRCIGCAESTRIR